MRVADVDSAREMSVRLLCGDGEAEEEEKLKMGVDAM
jgi:hypothetical protein